MHDQLRDTYYRLLRELNITTYRYLYPIFDLSNRLTGLIGPRGVGKTTLMLQYIKNKVPDPQQAFYFSADHIYFNKVTLLEFVQTLYETENIRLVFIDEIHKYPNWNQELKNIYDAFPRVNVVFSGSSSIDLLEGAHDLSRRAALYRLQGLSFREYLNIETESDHGVLDLDAVLAGQSFDKLAQIPKLLGHFATYLQKGYYPFVFEEGAQYHQRIEAVVDKTVFDDIANYYNLHTGNLHYFKKILYFLATIPPGKISTHNLAQNLGIDDKTTQHYIRILHATGLVRLLFADLRGSQLLRKPQKIFLDNTTLLHALCNGLSQVVDRGTVRELYFLNALEGAGEKVLYNRQAGDFNVRDAAFEVGGRNKGRQQVQHASGPAFVVKDGVLTGGKTTIPLYLFGFLY